MATHAVEIINRLNALRCALTGAVLLVLLLVICWGAVAAGFGGGSHMYISLFTAAPVTSISALAEGVLWSLVFGALGGALVALLYNSFAFVSRR